MFETAPRLSPWESWREAPERASPARQGRFTAIGRLFVRAILSLCLCFSVSVLALSVTFGDTARVAAPSIRSASLASCWPRPQQLLPVSAAGGGRRRCSQRERLSPHHKKRDRRITAVSFAQRYEVMPPSVPCRHSPARYTRRHRRGCRPSRRHPHRPPAAAS